MPKRLDTLNEKVSAASQKLIDKMESVTATVQSRVSQMRTRVEENNYRHRRRDSRRDLPAVKGNDR